METVNDLHGDLVNLARVVKDDRLGPALYRRLRRTLCCKALMDDAAARLKAAGRRPAPDVPDVARAEDYFLTCWLGINGVAGTASYNQGFCRRFTKSGGHAATRWANAIASIPQWRRRLQSVVILNECGIALCEKIEDARNVVIYCDPPYLVKGASYVHDFTPADHERLAKALNRFTRTRVVISYYDHPLLEKLYPGWHKIDCARTKHMVCSGMRDQSGVTIAPEVLLVNGKILGREAPGLFDA